MKDISRRDMLRGGTVVGAGLALGAADLLQPQRAAAATQPWWMATNGNLAALGIQTGSRGVFPVSYEPGSNSPTEYNGVAMLYSVNDIAGLNNLWPYAGYDLEKWSKTPLVEQQDPWTYGARFQTDLLNTSFLMVWAPARDLYYVPGIVKPPKSGESVDAWYERTELAGVAGSIYLCQSEVDEVNVTNFKNFVLNNASIARAAHVGVIIFAELATTQGTASQMIAAAESVWPGTDVAGFYLSVADGDYAKMQQVVHALGGP